ncbi:MAG TPA: hypothetical protein VMF62_10805 [Acetobacteraceae bacterium]|nr:hypothetical protein [Acetobacteraceae bacterium]
MPGSRKRKRPADDVLLNADEVAAFLKIRKERIYPAIKDGWLPPPSYALPKSPRWWRSEIVAALDKHMETPTAAVARRRAAILAREAAARVASREETNAQI